MAILFVHNTQYTPVCYMHLLNLATWLIAQSKTERQTASRRDVKQSVKRAVVVNRDNKHVRYEIARPIIILVVEIFNTSKGTVVCSLFLCPKVSK